MYSMYENVDMGDQGEAGEQPGQTGEQRARTGERQGETGELMYCSRVLMQLRAVVSGICRM